MNQGISLYRNISCLIGESRLMVDGIAGEANII